MKKVGTRCSRKIKKKTVQYQFVKKEYVDLLQLLTLYDMFGKYFNLLL